MIAATKKNAFLIHLLISVILLLVLLCIVFFIWFPYDLIYAGGISGLKIIFSVDLILGPLLTLIVFNPNKKKLKLDLLFVGIIQISSLCYGMWLIHSQRPVLQVLAHDGIHIISASDAKHYKLDSDRVLGEYPKKVMIHLPDDTSSWASIAFSTELADNKPFAFRDDLYNSFQDISSTAYNKRISHLSSKIKHDAIKSLSKSVNCEWIRVISFHNNGLACVNQTQGITALSNKKL